LEQLFGYLRDCMVAAAGCPAETFLHASSGSRAQVAGIGKRLGTENLLAAMQILDQTLSRLRYSTQGRILAELALVRICNLEDLSELSALIGQLQRAPAGGDGPPVQPPRAGAYPAPEVAKKKDELAEPAAPAGPAPPAEGRPVIAITPENAASLWTEALAKLSGLAVEHARHFEQIAIAAPNHLVIFFKPGYTFAKSVCERPDQMAKLEQALACVTGQTVRIEFKETETAPMKAEAAAPTRAVPPHQRIMQVAQHPMVRLAGELFGAHPVRVDEPPVTAPGEEAAPAAKPDIEILDGP